MGDIRLTKQGGGAGGLSAVATAFIVIACLGAVAGSVALYKRRRMSPGMHKVVNSKVESARKSQQNPLAATAPADEETHAAL